VYFSVEKFPEYGNLSGKFSFDLLVQSKASVERIQSRYDRLREVADGAGPASAEIRALLDAGVIAFDAALDDNLNVPNALAALFDLVTALNQREKTLSPGDSAAALVALVHCDDVLVVLDRRVRSGLFTKAEIDAAIAERSTSGDDTRASPLGPDAILGAIARRQAARSARDFAGADAARDQLKGAGVLIEDIPAGVRWKLSP